MTAHFRVETVHPHPLAMAPELQLVARRPMATLVVKLKKGVVMALPHAAAGEIVRIEPMGSTVIEGTKTHALVKGDRFEAARLVLPRGSAIAPHAVPGPITLYCIEGAITLEANRTVEMRAGDWLYLEGGERHALTAIEDSSLLLTIIFP